MRKTRPRVLWVAALTSLFVGTWCANIAPADEVAGVIVALTGNVRVRAADGTETRLAAPLRLHTGDAVTVGRAARAVIFQRTLPPVALPSGAEITVGPDGLAPKAALESSAIEALWKRIEFWLSIDRFKRFTEVDATAIARETTAKAKPGNTCILTERPKFSWERVSGVRSYMFSILEVTDIGEKRVYNAATANTHIAYPAAQPPLSPGSVYRWEAVGGNGRRDAEPRGGWILLLTEEKGAAIQEAEDEIRKWGAAAKDRHAAGLLLAELYAGEALYEPAHAELRKLARAENEDVIVAAFLTDVGSERQRAPRQ